MYGPVVKEKRNVRKCFYDAKSERLSSKTESGKKVSTSKNDDPSASFPANHVSVEIETHFKDTMKLLRQLHDHLRCVICGRIPEKILSTSRCEHKYCKKCAVQIEEKMCLICDVQVSNGDVKLDKFYTELIAIIEKFSSDFEYKIRQLILNK